MHPNEPKRIELARLPTPVVELKNLSKRLGTRPLFMKRDDLTGLELSGNKVRKLEYVVAEALDQGCDTLVTHGGFQSNHCRATAAIGARLGLRVRLLLRMPKEGAAENDGNLFLDRLLGARITMHSVEDYSRRLKELVAEAMEEEKRNGRRPYFFPVGASVPLGCWGYIRCIHELIEQLGRETKVDVYSALSSSGTFAGLILGKALFDLKNWTITGIPVSDSVEYFDKDVRELIGRTIAEFKLEVSDLQTPIRQLGGFIGDGYAIPTREGVEATKLLAESEGILLDPTYTAKAFAGFLHVIRNGQNRADAVPVFLHTGGVFGLMARRDLFPFGL